MGAIRAIFKRELGGYFATPIAYVFLTIFVLLSGVFTFYVGELPPARGRRISGPSSSSTPGSTCF